ncbi:MAG: hypothetical protein JWO14_2966 [Solirubrobacterales bacterium]|nr:hypothetical protein [Solirubrobacterales bacterium]
MAETRDTVAQLLVLRDWPGFRQWLDRHGGELEPALAILEEWRQEPDVGAAFAPWCDLIREATKDPEAAWQALEGKMESAVGLEAEIEQIALALDRVPPHVALPMVDEALSRAEESAAPHLIGALFMLRGNGLRKLGIAGRTEAVDEAITAYNDALKYVSNDATAALLFLKLAEAYGQRPGVDRHENRLIAIDLLRKGLDLTTGPESQDQRAALETELANFLSQHEDGDLRANHQEAIRLCRAALRHRTLKKDPAGWAYSTAVLGSAFLRLALLQRSGTDQARAVYEQLLTHQDEVDDPNLLVGAYFDMARTSRLDARRSPEDELRIAEAGTEDAERLREEALLAEAKRLLEAALDLFNPESDATRHGRIEGELALVLNQLGMEEDALARGGAALEVLSVDFAPRARFEVSAMLAAILAGREDWEGAAIQYRTAVETGELLFHTHRSSELQTEELQNLGELGRWAALALVKVGAIEEAVLVLENSRTRELRQRLDLGSVDKSALDALPDELRDAYQDARVDLSSVPLGPSSAAPAQAMQAVLALIRSNPEFANFGRGATLDDLFAAVEPDWPLLYINPTPAGLLFLLVTDAGGEDQRISAEFFDSPTSEHIILRLMAGATALGPRPDLSRIVSYLAAIVGLGDTRLEDALEEVLPWVGESIAKRAGRLLGGAAACGVTLVLCGPLGAVPVAACSWSANGGETCLLDQLDIRYAPSANLARSALVRARDRRDRERHLVALANPNENLDGAVPEAREIARHFEPKVELAEGPAADSRFLLRWAPAASHLHLSCHAGGGLFEAESIGILLADGPISAFRISGVGTLSTRLVVVSACQTAIPYIAGPSGEVFATTTALLAAGSACVVGSLWPVDDTATALLMVKFYDEMVAADLRPPEALRRAQLWLRGLNELEEASFLAEHPALAAEIRRRTEMGDRPGRRSPAGGPCVGDHRPFAEPEFWAPFIAVGV